MTYIVPCKNFNECGNLVERQNLTQNPSCFDCKRERKKWYSRERDRKRKLKKGKITGL